MRLSRSGRVLAGILIALVALAAIVYGFRDRLGAWAIPKIAGSATGTNISFSGMNLHGRNATFTGVTVSSRAGQKLAYIPSVKATYDLRDLLPGSKHRFGLSSIVVDRPQITIVHNPDGSYNIPNLFKKGGAANPKAAPLNFTARVTGGTMTITDRTRVDPGSQHLYVDDVNVDATVNTAARTHYTASMEYREGSRTYPIHGAGVIDANSALTLHHWTAAHVPLPRLVNYAVNNANISMLSGSLDGVDLRYYGKLAATAYMSGAKVRIGGLSQPVRNGHGRLDVYEGGLTTPGLFADVGSMPVQLTGGIADLSHPQMRMAVLADGNIAQLKTLVKSTAKLPMSGAVAAAMLVEGSVKKPLVLIRIASPRIEYRGVAIGHPHGLLAFDGQEADIFGFALSYDGFDLIARGRMALKSQPRAVEMLAHVSGSSNTLPYADTMLPGMQLHGDVLASGNDLKKIDTQGILEGSGGERQLAALFAIEGSGTGTAGPVSIEGPGRSVYASVALDRPHNRVTALLNARNFPLTLPHPAVSATMNGSVFADKRGNALGLLGDVRLEDAAYGKVRIASARARFAGGVGNVRVSSLSAHGSFGTLNAAGTIAGTNHIALEGRYDGSLSALSQFAGNLPARGAVDAPIALVYENGRALAQIRNARFTSASVRGVPINGLSATVGTRGKNVRVYAARATVANTGRASVAGSLGSGGQLAVSVANLDVGSLRGAGIPLQSGRANFAATMRGSLSAPALEGAAMLEDANYRRYPIDLETAFAYSGSTLRLNDGMVGLGPAVLSVDGTVGGVAMGAPLQPLYDLNAQLHGADAHALVALAQPKLAKQYIEGDIDADVHVGGAGKTPAVSGAISVPSGSVHGLAFRDLRGTLSGTAQDFALDEGHVQIGSTALAFAAAFGGGSLEASIRAPHADLSDFNDYFDAGDTLAGTGSLALSVANGHALRSSGRVRLTGVRYHRFEIGDAAADWSTRGRVISMNASVGGASGRGHVAGTVTLPASYQTIAGLASNTDTNLTANASGVDLGTWLPMLGYSAPVTGTLDAHGRVQGRFPDETLNADATVMDGTVGRVSLQQATIAVRATRGRGTIERALVQIPYLTASGSGTFGLHAADPLDLALHASSPDVGKLMASVNGKKAQISGALDTTLNVRGTRVNPDLTDTLALTSLRYGEIVVPRVSGTIHATRTQVVLQDGLVQLQHGSIVMSGLAPISMTPHFQLDPGNKPVRFALTADNVDFSNFSSTLPQGTRLAGTFGGALTVNGTVDDPQLNGTLNLHNGYFVGPIDQNPIQQLTGQLAFNGTKIGIYNLHANVGGGTMDLNGTASVPDVRDIRDATFKTTIVAKGAQFNSPKYFRGKIDANIVASRATPRSLPLIAGTVTVPSARIPLSAFWNPKAPQGPAKKLPDIALNIQATAGNDVRVQSSNVDVGAQGSVALSGTLPKPALSGSVTATGGTVDFFRRFTIESAAVRFDPKNGIMPYVNATATTQVSNPPTYIALNVSGLAPNNMQLALTSDPSYDRAQILGLLAGVEQLNKFGSGGGAGGFSVASTVQSLAAGQLNAFFSREMLEPLSAALGGALGLQNLQLTDDFNSGFGISAAKAFGKHLTVRYGQSLGTPRRQTLDIEAHHGESTAFDLLLYSVESPTLLGFQQTMGNVFGYNSQNLMNPTLGTNGVSLLYEHKFQ